MRYGLIIYPKDLVAQISLFLRFLISNLITFCQFFHKKTDLISSNDL